MFTLKEVIKNGGATLTREGVAVSYAKGYQVSIKDLYIIKTYKLRKSFIINLLSQYDYIGLWIENGNCYIDYSVNVATKKEAVKIGKLNNQLSIYNWRSQSVEWL